MKKYLSIFLIISSINIVYGQGKIIKTGDTIFVKENMFSYVMCPGNIITTDITGEHYNGGLDGSYMNGNTLFLQANDEKSITKNLFIKYEGGVWVGYISFSKNPKTNLYNIQEKKDTVLIVDNKVKLDSLEKNKGASSEIRTGLELSINNEAVKKSFDAFKNNRKIITESGINKSNLIIYVDGLKSDPYAIYISMNFKNNTQHNFMINRVYFEFFEGKQKLTEISPFFYNNVNVVNSNTSEELVYALKKYSITNKSFVRVHVLETNGNRELTFDISGKELNKY